MKKKSASIVIALITTITVLAFVTVQLGDSWQDGYLTLVADYDANPEDGMWQDSAYLADVAEMVDDDLYADEDLSVPTEPHPFAAALKAYMGAYGGVVHAYFVTLDDDGTLGVFATRPTTRVREYDDNGPDDFLYVYGTHGTLFYLQDGDVLQLDAPGLFVSGRYNRLLGRSQLHTHFVEIIYKLESERLDISTWLPFFSDEYIRYLLSDEDTARAAMDERDARAEYAGEKYGLISVLPPNLGHMRNTVNQTALILAMRIDCVPSLDTTEAAEQADHVAVIIGDTPVHFALQPPVLVDGRALAPLYGLFDLLGFHVGWQPDTQQVHLGGATTRIIITLDHDVFTADNRMVILAAQGEFLSSGEVRNHILDVPAQIIDGIIWVPIRAILESVGYDVAWEEETQMITIKNSN